jgi:uroporphyrinogen-III synthase
LNIPSRPVAVLVTRPAHQAAHLAELVEQRGWRAVRFPALEIIPVKPVDKVNSMLQRIDLFDALIFISVNAVNFALQANDGKIDRFKNHRIAAVGRVKQLLSRRELDVITVTSVEALENLTAMLGLQIQDKVLLVPLVVISERMRNKARAMGFKRIVIADSPSDAAIVETVSTVCNGEYSGRIE